MAQNAQELYLDLIKRCLANTIYQDGGYDPILQKPVPFHEGVRTVGADWPDKAHTMIGLKRLDNIHRCLKEILKEEIPGDCIETGVWRGGAVILMRAILKAYGENRRKVWVADSFSGLPPPNPDKYPADKGLNLCRFSQLSVSLEEVRSNFAKYGLLDQQVIFLKGLFSQTLQTAPIQKLSLLRLDGDLYESTQDALQALYEKVSVGGFIIIDDYYAIGACAEAVEDFRKERQIKERLREIDGIGVYWKKRG